MKDPQVGDLVTLKTWRKIVGDSSRTTVGFPRSHTAVQLWVHRLVYGKYLRVIGVRKKGTRLEVVRLDGKPCWEKYPSVYLDRSVVKLVHRTPKPKQKAAIHINGVDYYVGSALPRNVPCTSDLKGVVVRHIGGRVITLSGLTRPNFDRSETLLLTENGSSYLSTRCTLIKIPTKE